MSIKMSFGTLARFSAPRCYQQMSNSVTEVANGFLLGNTEITCRSKLFMKCLHQVLGFHLREEDSAVFASVLIAPRMKEHQDVFRRFSSDGD